MIRSLLILALALGPLDAAIGQTRPGQRPRNTNKERFEARKAEQLINEGAKLLQQGNTRLAAEKFRQALQLEPENDRAHAYAAEAAWKERRLEMARKHLELALRLNPQNAKAHLIAGQILMQEGKTLAAFDHWRKASLAVADEREKREAGKFLSQLRDKHPNWFSGPQPAPEPKSVETTPAPVAPKSVPTGVRPNLAVFTFAGATPAKETPGWGESLAEMLTTALINSGSYRIIERAQLHKILEEQALAQSGALDSETAVVVGKIMGLDAVVVGSVSALDKVLEADARILNVETGEALAAAHASAASPDDLRQMAETLARSIAEYSGSIPARAPVDSAGTLQK